MYPTAGEQQQALVLDQGPASPAPCHPFPQMEAAAREKPGKSLERGPSALTPGHLLQHPFGSGHGGDRHPPQMGVDPKSVVGGQRFLKNRMQKSKVKNSYKSENLF